MQFKKPVPKLCKLMVLNGQSGKSRTYPIYGVDDHKGLSMHIRKLLEKFPFEPSGKARSSKGGE